MNSSLLALTPQITRQSTRSDNEVDSESENAAINAAYWTPMSKYVLDLSSDAISEKKAVHKNIENFEIRTTSDQRSAFAAMAADM